MLPATSLLPAASQSGFQGQSNNKPGHWPKNRAALLRYKSIALSCQQPPQRKHQLTVRKSRKNDMTIVGWWQIYLGWNISARKKCSVFLEATVATLKKLQQMLNTAIIISAFAFSLSRLIILRQNTDESEKLVTATSLRNPHFFLLVEASLAVSSNQAT